MLTVLVCLAAALWQVALHYLPWQRLIGEHLRERPLWAYSLGTLGNLLAFVAHDIARNDAPAPGGAALVLVAITAAAGAATVATYLLDHVLHLRARVQVHEEKDEWDSL